MVWNVVLHSAFESEYTMIPKAVQTKLAAMAKLLEEFGPNLGRPYVDTLINSEHSNMKELRFNADDGVWRVAFAFDPERQAILLVAGDKSGANQKAFYKNLIQKADKRFNQWLEN